MSLLLDTHTVIWVLSDAKSLSARVRRVLERGRKPAFVSTVSLYEIELKRRRGRLPRSIKQGFESALSAAGYNLLPLAANDALAAAALPEHHRDPWDRIIIAQALERDFEVATVDEDFAPYGVKVFW
jgi:PIN domain nuclease of toxin-antitoxin system